MNEMSNLEIAANDLKKKNLSEKRRKSAQNTQHPRLYAKSPEQPEQPEQDAQAFDNEINNRKEKTGTADFETGTTGTADSLENKRLTKIGQKSTKKSTRFHSESPKQQKSSKQTKTHQAFDNKENNLNGLDEAAESAPKPLKPFFMMIRQQDKDLVASSSEQELLDLRPWLWRDRAPGLYRVPVVQESRQTPEGRITELKPGEPVWISIPFDLLASTDDGQGHGHGIAIRFESLHGHPHTWTLPRSLLVMEGRELFQKLYDMGFHMSMNGDSFHRLREYLNRARSENKDMPKALSVARTGWAPGRRFVLPDGVFGGDGTTLYYQSDDPKPSPYTQSGSFDGWREGVCTPLSAYDLPVFAMSCAFAGPLLEPLRIESGGFHFEGLTSTGKTSAMRLALSAWGNPSELLQTWNGTRVGAELVTAGFSDTLLAFDEMGQADPKAVGDVIYMMCNGIGRTRGNVRLTHRANLRWRALVISSGEKSLAQVVATANSKFPPAAGQETRLAHIPVDTDGCGIFNGLTDSVQRKALLTGLSRNASVNYGYAARAFLHRLTDPEAGSDFDDYAATVKAMACALAGSDATNEIERVALRFALVGFAGELATRWGITGWPDGRAEEAAIALFKRWRAHWGSASRDETLFLLRCDEWLSEYRMGAFVEIDPLTRNVIDARHVPSLRPFYGYTSLNNDRRLFYLNAAGWRDLTCQTGRGVALNALKRTQRMESGGDGDGGKKMRINGEASRYYVVRADGSPDLSS